MHKHRSKLMLLLFLLTVLLAGCVKEEGSGKAASSASGPGSVYYEIFVRAFADSDGDGIGDLNGVTSKLDYLKEMGIGGIWLMPIQASPSYHGYDVTDYYAVNPQYGTIDDFKKLLDEAHKRGIKVIMDLVVNHTSSQHPWFTAAAADKNSPFRTWYTWAEDGDSMPSDGATGSKPWHAKNGAHYLGIFWEGMPDLNFDNPDVRKEIIRAGQFWLKQGVDGFRLDAAKHIYEDFTSTAKKPETIAKNIAWWQEFRQGLNEVNDKAYLVGEIWDGPTVIAPYLTHLNSAFNFDLAKKLVSSAKSEGGADIASWLQRTYALYDKSSGGQYIDATFLTNHDQNRVMTELNGNQEHAKMAASLLLTLPGTPFIYYGEEIGMKGTKPDEYIREPMVWNKDGNTGNGQTQWIVSKYNSDHGASVEAERTDPHSIYSHYKQLIGWRNELQALRTGGIEPFPNKADNTVAAFVRVTAKEKLLVAHNLSDSAQTLSLVDAEGKKLYSKVIRSTSKEAKMSDGSLTLPPYTTVIMK